MAGIKKPAKQTTQTVITQAELPADGMVTIMFQGVEKEVTVQLAATLIKKGSATLKA
jgi:hypothetical protein